MRRAAADDYDYDYDYDSFAEAYAAETESHLMNSRNRGSCRPLAADSSWWPAV